MCSHVDGTFILFIMNKRTFCVSISFQTLFLEIMDVITEKNDYHADFLECLKRFHESS